MKNYLPNFLSAIDAVYQNKIRALLTGLGILFGVGAVISMLAIGNGAKQALLEQMKLVGTNNIVIRPVIEEFEEKAESSTNQEEEKVPYSPGLNLEDMDVLSELLPGISKQSPELSFPVEAMHNGRYVQAKCSGINNHFFELNGLKLESGKLFHPLHFENKDAVCIIGKSLQTKLFAGANPIGKTIKCGPIWLKVIGVIAKKEASTENLEQLGLRNLNMDVFVPVNTVEMRYENRNFIKESDIGRNFDEDDPASRNYHQLDKIVFQVEDASRLQATAQAMTRILKRRHHDVIDFEVEVPELLLQQRQKTQDTFNLVLAVIAGISLLVGGIGIMNIMLASVLERVREIGLRRACGAQKSDIILQFLFEAVFISLLGGILGILVGIISAKIIASYAEIKTVVTALSIILSFGIATAIGIIFGIFPAKKAAEADPIKALRTE